MVKPPEDAVLNLPFCTLHWDPSPLLDMLNSKGYKEGDSVGLYVLSQSAWRWSIAVPAGRTTTRCNARGYIFSERFCAFCCCMTL